MNPMPLALKDCLPSTGAEGLSPWLVVLAVVVIVGGAALILATKRTRASAAVGIIAVVLAASVIAGGAAPTSAVAADAACATATPTSPPTVVLDPLVAPNIVFGEGYDYTTSPGFYIWTLSMDSLGITTPNAGATVDWASVDLQPDVAGIQHTADAPLTGWPGEFAHLAYDPVTRVLTATANWSSSPGAWTGHYVVSDTLGARSNSATIVTYFAT